MNMLKKTTNRSGFTLIELLLVIAIIGVLSSLALVVVRGAQDEARRASTISRVNQIRTLLLDRFEDYEIRRVPIDWSNYSNILTTAEQRQISQRVIADFMLTEMPMPVIDPTTGNVIEVPELMNYPSAAFEQWILGFEMQLGVGFADAIITELQGDPPSLPNMVERVRAIINGFPNPNDCDLSGEFLYVILQTTDRDGQSGIEILTDSAVTDVDQDDIPEIADAWGDPFGIQFDFVEPNLPNGSESLPDAIKDLARISFLEINNIRIQLFSNELY